MRKLIINYSNTGKRKSGQAQLELQKCYGLEPIAFYL